MARKRFYHIPYNVFLDYIGNRMGPKEKEVFELYLKTHPDEAAIVESIQQQYAKGLCREELEVFLESARRDTRFITEKHSTISEPAKVETKQTQKVQNRIKDLKWTYGKKILVASLSFIMMFCLFKLANQTDQANMAHSNISDKLPNILIPFLDSSQKASIPIPPNRDFFSSNLNHLINRNNMCSVTLDSGTNFLFVVDFTDLTALTNCNSGQADGSQNTYAAIPIPSPFENDSINQFYHLVRRERCCWKAESPPISLHSASIQPPLTNTRFPSNWLTVLQYVILFHPRL